MRRAIPIILWVLVAIAAWSIIASRVATITPEQQPIEESTPPGIVLVDVPWEHLQDVDRFELTDQNGDNFDTAKLVGKPYVVSFFFATCPTFCLDLNKEIERINRSVKNVDMQFLTISVDPDKDTPEVLGKYAERFGAKPERWAFLTGDLYKIKEVGEHMFNVVIDKNTHTDSILLVDKWGRYRDRFKWDQPYDMKRFVKVAKELAAETEPPFGQTIKTRNAMAGHEPKDMNNVRWIREFHLTERSGEPFFSRQLTGEVWVGSFFFSSCPGICKKQNEYIRSLQKRLADKAPKFVSITTDSVNDTPQELRKYADGIGADSDNWLFLTGNSHLIERIGSEFFHAQASEGHHSSLFYVVDRWGDIRGSFDWQDIKEETEMIRLIDELRLEQRPPNPLEVEKEVNEADKSSGGDTADDLDEDNK